MKHPAMFLMSLRCHSVLFLFISPAMLHGNHARMFVGRQSNFGSEKNVDFQRCSHCAAHCDDHFNYSSNTSFRMQTLALF